MYLLPRNSNFNENILVKTFIYLDFYYLLGVEIAQSLLSLFKALIHFS